MKKDTPAIPAADMTPVEADAVRLLQALEAHIVAGSEAAVAQRYGERLRFALARVEELRMSANGLGGVFEPARLEVSLSILESNVRQAGMFAAREDFDHRGLQRHLARIEECKPGVGASDVARQNHWFGIPSPSAARFARVASCFAAATFSRSMRRDPELKRSHARLAL